MIQLVAFYPVVSVLAGAINLFVAMIPYRSG